MDISALVAQYGLLAVFAGALLEGETVLALAGWAAHRGYLDLAAVVAVAWVGGVAGDQIYFWLGRRHGRQLLARRPALAARIARATRLIERHPNAAILAMRFLWGLRTALPVAAGMSRVAGARFVVLNLVSAALWAPLVAGLGWLFGAAVTRALGTLEHIEIAVFVLAMIAALVFAWWRAR
jgi:membrane protein DedA with SNARE-associated domain